MKKSNNFCKINITPTLIVMILIIVGLLGIFSINIAQNVPWIQKTDMPSGRHSHAASVVDGKIYVAGGRYTLNLLNEYDPSTDTWTTKASMPTGRMILSGCAVNGKFYTFGGIAIAYEPALSTVEEYDPITNTWTTKTSMPTKRLGLGTSVVDGKIYAIGGMTSGSNFWSGMRDTVEIYDPETDSWSVGSNMPTKRCWFSTSVVGGKIYAIGGALVTKQPLSVVEVYDPATDTWTTKAPMPTARIAHAAAVVNGIIYVIGGGTVNGQPVGSYSIVEAYDPVTDTWTRKADIPKPRAYLSANEIDGKIYAIGGIPNGADPHLQGEKTVYVYDPSKDLAAVINQFNINKCFAEAGNDSICITTKLTDPAGIKLLAKIQAPDQTPTDSVQLFDDGNHNDGNPGDSVYANVWPVSSIEERQYFMDLQVTKVDTDTIVQYIDNMALFTTVGPLVFEELSLGSSDTEPNPGDEVTFKITLKNNGSIASATDVKVKLSSLDTLVTVINNNRPFKDIEAGNSKTSLLFKVKISENCPDSTEVKFAMDISSNDYPFWTDTCSILVVEPTTGINLDENTPRQFILDQNYPNPFNPKTVIGYSVGAIHESPVHVDLSIYNILGQKVATLVSEKQAAGNYSVNWDASGFSSGVYLYKLETGNGYSQAKKLVLLK